MMENNEEESNDPRLALKDLAIFAYNTSRKLESTIRRNPWSAQLREYDEDLDSFYVPLVREIIMEASAMNHNAVMARHWDIRVGRLLENGWRYGTELNEDEKISPDILPWCALPEIIRMREIFFRQSVLALIPAWNGN